MLVTTIYNPSEYHKMNSPVHNASFYDRVIILEQGNFLLSCMTTLRNYETSPIDFHRTFEVVSTQLIAAGRTCPLLKLITEIINIYYHQL